MSVALSGLMTSMPNRAVAETAFPVLLSLIQEHQLISRVVAALEVYAHQIRQCAPVLPEDLAHFARVFDELGDQLHHEKEENILLPFLSRHGFDWGTGVLRSVRSDHRQERYLIDVLSQAGERSASWSSEDRRQIAAASDALCEFQRRHHELENEKLFPEVIARLDADTLALLRDALEGFDREPQHEALRAAAEQLAKELTQRYPASLAAAASQ
jgi:hemerythrin-like domain-containing protein